MALISLLNEYVNTYEETVSERSFRWRKRSNIPTTLFNGTIQGIKVPDEEIATTVRFFLSKR